MKTECKPNSFFVLTAPPVEETQDLVLHPAVRELLYPTQPKALYSGKAKEKNKRVRAQNAAFNDVSFDAMGVGSMAVIGNEQNCPGSTFRVKFGRKLSQSLSLVQVVKRDVAARKLVFQFFRPVEFSTMGSRFMSIEVATGANSFEKPQEEEWRLEFEFPQDNDIAGITVGAWDVEEGDNRFPVSEYKKVQYTVQHHAHEGESNVENAPVE